jgi:hypothetical protein
MRLMRFGDCARPFLTERPLSFGYSTSSRSTPSNSRIQSGP